jgi:hypothetical protein
MRLAPFWQDQPDNPVAGDATLDEILRLNARRDPDGAALVAPDLPFVTTWRDVDRAASALAGLFRSWGLGEDAVVGVQLGSGPQAALTCLALWRAGLVPAMLPLAWRRRETVAALASVGATAIVAAAHGGGAALAQMGCEIAAGLDDIRFVGCFGDGAPDGATPLDQTLDMAESDFADRPDRPEDAADHVAVVTFDAGGTPVPRSHNDLIAAGLGPLIASKLVGGSALLSTLDLASIAGLASGLAPWLTTGCAASFHQPSSTAAFAAAARFLGASHAVLPGRAAARLASDGALDGVAPRCVTALWRAPDGRGAAPDVTGAAAIVDAIAFGELGLWAAARPARDRHPPLPLGPSGPDGFAPLIELAVTSRGRLGLRGPACPQAPCPAAPGVPPLLFDAEGFLETGLTAVADRTARRLTVGGRRRGIVQVGGLGLALTDAEAAYRRVGVEAKPEAQDDPVFGARLAVRDAGGESAAKAAAALRDAGFGPAFAPAPAAVVERALRSA